MRSRGRVSETLTPVPQDNINGSGSFYSVGPTDCHLNVPPSVVAGVGVRLGSGRDTSVSPLTFSDL